MTNTIKRGEIMDKIISYRCTQQDHADIKLAAQKELMDISSLIRRCLVKAGIITPLGTTKDKWE